MPLTHEEIQRLDWKVILRPYWSIQWRQFMLTMALFMLGQFVILAFYEREALGIYFFWAMNPIIGLIVIKTAMFLVVKTVFQKKYRDFKINIVSSDSNEVIPITGRIRNQIFFSLIWREISLLAGASAVSYALEMIDSAILIDVWSIGSIFVHVYFSLIIYRIVLQKRYSDFRVAVIPHETSAQPSE